MNDDINKRIELLEARNKRVEADKSWETSWTRRVILMLLTYLVVVSYLYFVLHIDPWVNALIPVMGFFVSTFTLSLAKNYWLSRRD